MPTPGPLPLAQDYTEGKSNLNNLYTFINGPAGASNINLVGNDNGTLETLKQQALAAAADAANLQTYVTFEDMEDDTSQSVGTPADVMTGEGAGRYVMTMSGWERTTFQPVSGENFKVSAADPLLEVVSSDESRTIVQSADGSVFLPGMGGRSVQDKFGDLVDLIHSNEYQSAYKDSQLKTEVNLLKGAVDQQAVKQVEAPYISKLSDAEDKALAVYDLNEGVYLPGISHVSLGERINGLQNRMEQQYQHGRIFHAYLDFGINYNGKTPQTKQIQAAVDHVWSLGGGTIYFPKGVYKTTANIVARPGVNITGDGWGKTIFMPMGDTALFRVTVSGPKVDAALYQDFEIDGSLEKASNVGSKGFFLAPFSRVFMWRVFVHDTGGTGFGSDYAESSYILDCRAEGCGRGGTPGVSGGRSGFGIGTGRLLNEPLILSRCYSYNNNNFGAFFEQQRASFATNISRGVIVSQLVCRGNYRGFGDAGLDELILSDCQLTDNTFDGFVCDSGTLTPSPENPRPRAGKNGLIVNTQIARNGGSGFHYDAKNLPSDGGGYRLKGVNIRENGLDGITLTAREGSVVNDMSFSDVDLVANGGHGINVTAGGTWADLDISGVRALRNAGSAVNIDANVDGGRLFGCVARDTQQSPTQTMLLTGSGNISNFDISENHYAGPNTGTAIDLPNADPLTVTYGRNPGAQ